MADLALTHFYIEKNMEEANCTDPSPSVSIPWYRPACLGYLGSLLFVSPRVAWARRLVLPRVFDRKKNFAKLQIEMKVVISIFATGLIFSNRLQISKCF